MNVKYRTVLNIGKTKVICDTNVWYGFTQGKPIGIDDVHILIPTFLTLAELVTSEVIVHDTRLFQTAIREIYEKCGPIIQLDPIDYVLNQQDPKYPINDRGIKKILESFSHVLSLNLDEEIVVDQNLKNAVIDKCRSGRKATVSFAEFANSNIIEIRKNINTGMGKEKHLEIDATDINKEMIKSIFNEHVKGSGYIIDWNKFDWGKIDLFMKVTGIFFKKLETTRDMKVKPNDAIDWLNMLYVSPEDKYLTFESVWRNYIENDDRIKHYLYK